MRFLPHEKRIKSFNSVVLVHIFISAGYKIELDELSIYYQIELYTDFQNKQRKVYFA